MRQPTVIALDGSQRPVHDGSIAFAVGSVATPRPRRPLAGLAIAFVTAVMAMGALGPRPAAPVPASGVEIAAAGADDGFAALGGRARLEATEAPRPTTAPWWELPQMALWVDPATGRAMQAAADEHARPRLADHRARET